MTVATNPTWDELLLDAVQTPGRILEAYTLFHNYSLGNALSALFQCTLRGITPGPINTFLGWKELGRYVRKGERAITLVMPLAGKKKAKETTDTDEHKQTYVRFIERPHWFVLAQTEGQEFTAVQVPNFDTELALAALNITRVPFEMLDGNAQGYAQKRSIAINPIAALPHKTLFHEVGHVVLGHTEEGQLIDHDDERTPRNIREVEAEAVALLCCASLKLEGIEYSRGYIQHWLSGNPIPTSSVQRIFSAAAAILKAGQAKTPHRELQLSV